MWLAIMIHDSGLLAENLVNNINRMYKKHALKAA